MGIYDLKRVIAGRRALIELIFSSFVSSLLNLGSLTVAAVKIKPTELDYFFVQREALDSVLKIFFISQVGSIVVSEFSNDTLRKKNLLFLFVCSGLIISCCLFLWLNLLSATNFSILDLSLVDQNLNLSLKVFYIALVVFSVCTWFDAIATSLLNYTLNFRVNFGLNSVGSAITFCGVVFIGANSIESISLSFAIGKLFSTFSKASYLLLSDQIKIDTGSKESQKFIPQMLVKAAPYLTANLLQFVNKFFMLAGVKFLDPGSYSIYTLVYRYYSAFQNLVTVNLTNSSIINSTADEKSILLLKAIEDHVRSFYALGMLFSLSYFFISVFFKESSYFAYALGADVKLMVAVIVMTFLPDGLNYILSKDSIANGEVSWDARLTTAQVVSNILFISPSMYYFKIKGLVIVTLIILCVFSGIRVWKIGLLPRKLLGDLSLFYVLMLFIIGLYYLKPVPLVFAFAGAINLLFFLKTIRK